MVHRWMSEVQLSQQMMFADIISHNHQPSIHICSESPISELVYDLSYLMKGYSKKSK